MDIAPGAAARGEASRRRVDQAPRRPASTQKKRGRLLTSPSSFLASPLPALGFDQHGFRRSDYDPRNVSVDQDDLPGIPLSPALFREKELNGQPVPVWVMLCLPSGHDNHGLHGQSSSGNITVMTGSRSSLGPQAEFAPHRHGQGKWGLLPGIDG